MGLKEIVAQMESDSGMELGWELGFWRSLLEDKGEVGVK